MSAPAAARVVRLAGRSTARWAVRGQQGAQVRKQVLRAGLFQANAQAPRYFSISSHKHAGLMPESEDPQPPNPVEEPRPQQPTHIDDDEYHMRADEYMDAIHEKAEAIQEAREDVEVEYSVYSSVRAILEDITNQSTRLECFR